MVATKTFELPFFRKSMCDDFSWVATKLPKNLENPPGFFPFDCDYRELSTVKKIKNGSSILKI